MKNIFILFIAIGIFTYPQITNAQTKSADGLEFIEEFVESEEAAIKGRNKSENLLSEKPNILKLRENEERLLLENEKKRDELAQKINEKKFLELKKQEAIEYIKESFEQAPFGLYWNATKEDMESIGFVLTPGKRENYDGVYRVENPKQTYTTFEQVHAIFGLQNHLLCIYAQSIPQPDKPDASKVLQLYRQYYQALQKKYGNDKEVFIPYTYIEEKVEGDDEEKKVTRIQHENPLGGENFLEELQTGKATLYATFENGKIGVTLSVFGNEKQEGFITVDYKDLNIVNIEKETNIDNLMDDL